MKHSWMSGALGKRLSLRQHEMFCLKDVVWDVLFYSYTFTHELPSHDHECMNSPECDPQLSLSLFIFYSFLEFLLCLLATLWAASFPHAKSTTSAAPKDTWNSSLQVHEGAHHCSKSCPLTGSWDLGTSRVCDWSFNREMKPNGIGEGDHLFQKGLSGQGRTGLTLLLMCDLSILRPCY